MPAARHENFDLRDLPDSFYADPYPVYRLLREKAPVLELPGGGYFISNYEHLMHVYRDARRFSSDKFTQFGPVFGQNSLLFEHHTTSLVFNDPPLHTNVRKAIGNALSNRMVVEMQLGVESLIDELLDDIADRRQFDLIADFASAIPIEIIGNMLAVPRAERGPLRRWSLAILGSLEVGLDQPRLDEGNRCVSEFLDYLLEFVPRRRGAMTEADDDILIRLLRWESDGYRLTESELYHQCIFLLNAGHETTTNLVGNGVELLMRFPDVLGQLKQQPGLIDSAIEEVLRYESSNQLGNRTTTEDIEIDGAQIPADTVLTLCIGAANRDPAVFENPDVFNIERNPNPHLAFGSGIHTCAGLNVARLEGRIAIGKLIARFPSLELTSAGQRAHRARFRGFESLPMSTGE